MFFLIKEVVRQRKQLDRYEDCFGFPEVGKLLDAKGISWKAVQVQRMQCGEWVWDPGVVFFDSERALACGWT